MSGNAELIHAVGLWVTRAEEDFLVADRLLVPHESCPFSSICFHVQQCVEKYIKAILISKGISAPKIHDLSELLTLLPATVQLPLDAENLERITSFATFSRYPGDWEPITREEAEQAVATARKVREAARAHLPKEALE